MTIALAVHGGAGPPVPAHRAPAVHAGLARALEAGHALLAAGRPALDAAQAAVAVLEDEPVFNAGRGAALTAAGQVELDAALMDGASRRVGAVAAVIGVRHPIDLARAVLDDGRHVLLAGEGALAFARARGIELRPREWFVSERPDPALERRLGTVGAVARDAAGHLAAATSTGGRAGQHPGRVGDSPLPGAGTWADDDTLAVSCTGEGEAFVRALVAHEIDALMRHRDLPLAAACKVALHAASAHGGTGGVVAIDREGAIALPYTSPAMSRGWRVGSAAPQIAV